MFNANRGQEDGGEEQAEDEYFDDAGDIGYLPADHVSYQKFKINIFSFSP